MTSAFVGPSSSRSRRRRSGSEGPRHGVLLDTPPELVLDNRAVNDRAFIASFCFRARPVDGVLRGRHAATGLREELPLFSSAVELSTPPLAGHRFLRNGRMPSQAKTSSTSAVYRDVPLTRINRSTSGRPGYLPDQQDKRKPSRSKRRRSSNTRARQ